MNRNLNDIHILTMYLLNFFPKHSIATKALLFTVIGLFTSLHPLPKIVCKVSDELTTNFRIFTLKHCLDYKSTVPPPVLYRIQAI